ncbi:MAG: hypothetical protein Q8835_02840 [Sweet potato little leaf phytoplasma]|nr:hypothetical protein [Sweet potato little leaf phytoplasma]
MGFNHNLRHPLLLNTFQPSGSAFSYLSAYSVGERMPPFASFVGVPGSGIGGGVQPFPNGLVNNIPLPIYSPSDLEGLSIKQGNHGFWQPRWAAFASIGIREVPVDQTPTNHLIDDKDGKTPNNTP